MSSSLTIDLSGINDLIERLQSPAIREGINKIAESKEIIALVAQAIADNFDQEGPGWAPLKAKTIRSFVNKKLKKKLSSMTDKEIEHHEAQARKDGKKVFGRILDRTGTLRNSVTTPGAMGNISKNDNGTLIWGTKVVYAGIHNYGDPKKGMPQREFLVIHDGWKIQIYQKALDLAVEVLAESLK